VTRPGRARRPVAEQGQPGRIGVVNGQRGRVEAVDLAKGTVLLKGDDGKHVILTAAS
jgi:hypothetical protein